MQGLCKEEFHKLLMIATTESFFIFNGNCYKQIEGVAIGSLLGPTRANAFLCYHEKIWLRDCPEAFKPKFYKRYVDDIYMFSFHRLHLSSFKVYLNSRHQNITFSSETEIDGKMAFLDIQIQSENNTFVYFCVS